MPEDLGTIISNQAITESNATDVELEAGGKLDTCYLDVTRAVNGFVEKETIYVDAEKTKKLVEQTYTRTGGIVTSIIIDVYDLDTDTIKYTTTKTINRITGKYTGENRVRVET